jgi:4-hydroxybenzoyl-CoA thioesterase
MVDSLINYVSEGFYSDHLVVEVTVDNIFRSECDFYYKLTNQKTGKEVARVKTGMLFFDYDSRKRLNIPEGFQKKIIDLTSRS